MKTYQKAFLVFAFFAIVYGLTLQASVLGKKISDAYSIKSLENSKLDLDKDKISSSGYMLLARAPEASQEYGGKDLDSLTIKIKEAIPDEESLDVEKTTLPELKQGKTNKEIGRIFLPVDSLTGQGAFVSGRYIRVGESIPAKEMMTLLGVDPNKMRLKIESTRGTEWLDVTAGRVEVRYLR